MPQIFNPGHRPSAPLFPEELVYCTTDDVANFLQLPLPDPIALAGDSTNNSNNADHINLPISGANYRRWKIDTGISITVYDDNDALGKTYSVLSAESGGSGNVNIVVASKDNPNETFTTAANAQIQINSAFTNSKERGLTKAHVEELIRKKQDYIDTICRMAWRPRIVADEYQNFTTFKPYRRRYYTDYVGAVYLRHSSVQRVLRLSIWQGDKYRELASSIVQMTVDSNKITAQSNIFLCPGVAHVATLSRGKTASTWDGDFGNKTTAQNIANLINKDPATGREDVAIGTLQELSKQLNVDDEFLATANSDEGDGVILLSSMRSTEEGENSTFAFSNPEAFTTALHHDTNSKVTDTSNLGGSGYFEVEDNKNFLEKHGLVYYTKGGVTYVALCTKGTSNRINVVTEITPNFNSNLATNDVVKQDRLKTDVIDEDRQKDWWSMEDHGAIMFNNQYPFYENHSIKVSYIYGERYLDKTVKEACIKLVAMDILMTDDYTVLFPEGTNNIDLNAKVQKLDEEVKRMLIPYQETIIVAGMGG
tara:strand:+ start:5697 stop:7307 length:1611 start_codon:yes stop_codon:yes gene_type:complete